MAAIRSCRLCAGSLNTCLPSRLSGEGNVRMRQREAFEHGGAVGVFSVFGFEELASRRCIEEEFGGFDGGADGVGGGGGAAEFAVFCFDLGRVNCLLDGWSGSGG